MSLHKSLQDFKVSVDQLVLDMAQAASAVDTFSTLLSDNLKSLKREIYCLKLKKHTLGLTYQEKVRLNIAKIIVTGCFVFFGMSINAQCIGLHVQVDNVDSVEVILDKVIGAYKKIGVNMWVEAIVEGKEEYLAYSSADYLLHQFAYGPKYSDVNLYLTSRDLGGGVSYRDMLCNHFKWIASDGREIGWGPFAVIPDIENTNDGATRIAKKIGYLVGVGELSGSCDGTIMNHSRCADISNGFGTYADEIRNRVNNAECLKSLDHMVLTGNVTGYASAATVSLDGNATNMVIAAYEFTMNEGELNNVEVIQQTCKYDVR